MDQYYSKVCGYKLSFLSYNTKTYIRLPNKSLKTIS